MKFKDQILKVVRLPINRIRLAKYNPRKDLRPGDPEYEKIKRSIEEFGLVDPLVVNAYNSVLVGGHQRLKVLRDLKWRKVPVSVVDIKDPRREKALNIALNKVEGAWDELKLSEILKSLESEDFDIKMIGFSDEELKKLMDWKEDTFFPTNSDTRLDEIKPIECPKCGHKFTRP